jgi:hypothetical protein
MRAMRDLWVMRVIEAPSVGAGRQERDHSVTLDGHRLSNLPPAPHLLGQTGLAHDSQPTASLGPPVLGGPGQLFAGRSFHGRFNPRSPRPGTMIRDLLGHSSAAVANRYLRRLGAEKQSSSHGSASGRCDRRPSHGS